MVSRRSTPGITGKLGKWPSKTGLQSGTLAIAWIRPRLASNASTRSIISKYSSRMERSGALRRHQLVDASTEVLQDEVVVHRRPSLVDLLGPAFEGDLDAELLVEGKDDVEKVETVDAEIVNGMGFRGDLLERDLARFGDDLGYYVERRGHEDSSNPLPD